MTDPRILLTPTCTQPEIASPLIPRPTHVGGIIWGEGSLGR